MSDVTGEQFAQALARELGLPPIERDEVAELLALASTAAHSSERLAAPLCTYLAGRSGLAASEVHDAARRVAEKKEGPA